MILRFLTAMLACALLSKTLDAQTLTVSLAGGPDTVGLSAYDLSLLERNVQLHLPNAGASTDTLVVEVGPTSGNYDLLRRSFPLDQTGTFADGCSLAAAGSGLTVGLGSYTGLSTFHVRAYLTSSGPGSAMTVDSE